MVQLLSTLTALAVAFTISAAPLTVPQGSTGLSSTISADDQGISVGSKTITLYQAMSHVTSCRGRGWKAAGHRGAGAAKGTEKGGAAADLSTAAVTNTKAIYFMTNAATNSILALKTADDGTLSDGSITATGGARMNGLDSNGSLAAPNVLFSQGAVRVAVNNLVAMNPGSNTVLMFTIDSADPTRLTVMGQSMDTLREFPMSVALSTTLSQTCVVNSGSKAGIACFTISADSLTLLGTNLRAFNINQTTLLAPSEVLRNNQGDVHVR